MKKSVLRKKILIAVFAVTALLLVFTGRSECAQVVDRIVAVVNDDIITLSELNEIFEPFKQKIKDMGYPFDTEQKLLFKVRTEKLNELIDRKLADQEIKQQGIKVEEKDIDSTIERFKKRNSLTDEKLRESLKQEGSTMAKFRERIKEELLRNKLINYEVKSKIVITREDIQAYYDAHAKAYEGVTELHIRNILMTVSQFASDDEKKAVLNKMKKVLTMVNEGQAFGELAKKFSEGPNADRGGDLGSYGLKELSPQLQEALKAAKTGTVTPILETSAGYQIFFVEDIVSKAGKSIEEMTPEIEEKLYGEVIDKKYQEWLEGLRKKALIKIIQ